MRVILCVVFSVNINDALGGGEDMDDNITFDDMDDDFDGADDDIDNVSCCFS